MSMRTFMVLAVTAALALAGCGTAEKNDYVSSVNQATTEMTKALSSVGNVGSDPAQMAVTLQKGSDAIEKAATDFEAIDPPDNAKHAHGLMVDGLHSLATTFKDAADAAKAKDTDKIVAALGNIQSRDGAKKIKQAQTELKKNGYKFESWPHRGWARPTPGDAGFLPRRGRPAPRPVGVCPFAPSCSSRAWRA